MKTKKLEILDYLENEFWMIQIVIIKVIQVPREESAVVAAAVAVVMAVVVAVAVAVAVEDLPPHHQEKTIIQIIVPIISSMPNSKLLKSYFWLRATKLLFL